MPEAPSRLCAQPGCSELVASGTCERHSRNRAQDVDRHRPSSTARGYDRRWRKASKAFLGEHPLCVDCLAEGRSVGATVVDHDTPHRGDPALFWDERNWRARCKPHHDAKTAREDGGFGNPAAAMPQRAIAGHHPGGWVET